MDATDKRRRDVYYGFKGLPDLWSNDFEEYVNADFFRGKDYDEYTFDNFLDLDRQFGHEKSCFGTRGLPVGHPGRSSKTFDRFNKAYGPGVVRVLRGGGGMRHLLEYNEFRPDPVEVAKWRQLVDSEYTVSDFQGEKIVVVDDKMNFLTGNFVNKKRLVGRIYNDISGKHSHIRLHTPSLRKAVKDWVDSHAL